MLSRRAFLLLPAALPAHGQPEFALSHDDEVFLEDLSARAFRYFWEQADPRTGLVLDRARNNGEKTQGRTEDVASMATTGFGLAALSIAYRRRWMNPAEITERVRVTLRHLANVQRHQRGWFYHFVDIHTGDRAWKSELSTIDTALLLAGVLTAQQCFQADAEIARMAQEIYERVDFRWMLDNATGYLRMGWKPESGFLRAAWVNYRENAILHILAIGSPVHSIPVRCWYTFTRDPVVFENYRYVGAGPLFTHQFSQAWLDLRDVRDGPPYSLNYFQNSVVATLAHRAFCLSLRSAYPSYSDNLWGITPSDSDIGYVGWGNAFSRRDIDGTVVPCAPAGSLMFTPRLSLAALRAMREQFGRYIYGRYGFADAFHPISLWVDSDVVGINQGITLLSAENLRARTVWNWFNRQPNVRWAIDRIFQPDA
jgi:hypothetical protein